jgi:hypothetical protein
MKAVLGFVLLLLSGKLFSEKEHDTKSKKSIK